MFLPWTTGDESWSRFPALGDPFSSDSTRWELGLRAPVGMVYWVTEPYEFETHMSFKWLFCIVHWCFQKFILYWYHIHVRRHISMAAMGLMFSNRQTHRYKRWNERERLNGTGKLTPRNSEVFTVRDKFYLFSYWVFSPVQRTLRGG